MVREVGWGGRVGRVALPNSKSTDYDLALIGPPKRLPACAQRECIILDNHAALKSPYSMLHFMFRGVAGHWKVAVDQLTGALSI